MYYKSNFFRVLGSFRTKTNASVASDIVDFLIAHPYIHFIENYIRLNLISADADDNKFCDCCFSASAKYLITNDKHFEVLREIEFPSLPLVNTSQIRNFYFTE